LPTESALCPYIAPKPSRALAAFLLSAHGVSLTAAWLNPLPVWLRLALSAGVFCGGWLAWRRWRQPAISGLRQSADGGWVLQPAAGAKMEASLLGSSLANRYFVLLHFRAESRPLALLICRDSLPADDFRRLRIALAIAGKGVGNDSPLNP